MASCVKCLTVSFFSAIFSFIAVNLAVSTSTTDCDRLSKLISETPFYVFRWMLNYAHTFTRPNEMSADKTEHHSQTR